MSITESNVPAAQADAPELDPTRIFAVDHEREGAMGLRSLTVERFEEIRRRLADGRGIREIARALSCSRDTVREVRDGLRQSPKIPKQGNEPLWVQQVDWLAVIHDLGLGHPLRFIWDERAQSLTSYPNFWKTFYRKFPQHRQAEVTARVFEPGQSVEVDYAGDPIEWVEMKTGEIRKAYVFVAGLGFSQLLFAWAAEDMKSRNWLGCHRRMYAFYGGVPHTTVPDCLKQGVLKCHLYDPDLNPGYAQLARDFSTAVVPARAGRPKDKAVVEGLVRILMRYARFRYRRAQFTSLYQINQALNECVQRINDRRHSRFGVSRRERFEALERAALKALPTHDVDSGEWITATLHPDCYVLVEAVLYSAPHIHRHKKLRIKLTENHVEIFLNLERLAIHPRSRHRDGRRIKIDAHFPPASQAYYEATPQKLLSQSRFIHPELHRLCVELFNADVYGNLRRVQGFVGSSTKEINTAGHDVANPRIAAAIDTMRRYDKFRVPYFQALLAQARKQTITPGEAREIVRRPGNPMLRYAAGADRSGELFAAVPSDSIQEK
jgi:transposase